MAPKKRKAENSKAELGIQPVVDLSQLNLFLRKEMQLQIQEVNDESILPTGILQENAPIVFNIKGDIERFLDPSSVRLKISAKIVNGDGTDLPPASVCAPIANMAMSLFNRVIVTLGNSTMVSSASDHYPYIAYLHNVLKSSQEYKKQYDYILMIFRDAQSNMDATTEEGNPGFFGRLEQFAGSIQNHMIASIVSPITSQEKLIIPSVDLNFVLHPASAVFLVRSAEANPTQKMVITSISMSYRKVRLNTNLHLEFLNALSRCPALYPVLWQRTFEFSQQAGVRSIRQTVFTDGLLPSRVFIFVVSTARRVGSYATTPWLIRYNDLRGVQLVAGSDTYPRLPYNPQFRITSQMFLEATGMDNGISIADYEGGYGIIAINLARSGNSDVAEVPRVSNLEKWRQQLLHCHFTK